MEDELQRVYRQLYDVVIPDIDYYLRQIGKRHLNPSGKIIPDSLEIESPFALAQRSERSSYSLFAG